MSTTTPAGFPPPGNRLLSDDDIGAMRMRDALLLCKGCFEALRGSGVIHLNGRGQKLEVDFFLAAIDEALGFPSGEHVNAGVNPDLAPSDVEDLLASWQPRMTKKAYEMLRVIVGVHLVAQDNEEKRWIRDEDLMRQMTLSENTYRGYRELLVRHKLIDIRYTRAGSAVKAGPALFPQEASQ